VAAAAPHPPGTAALQLLENNGQYYNPLPVSLLHILHAKQLVLFSTNLPVIFIFQIGTIF
jgi:hypothetical protein